VKVKKWKEKKTEKGKRKEKIKSSTEQIEMNMAKELRILSNNFCSW